RTLRPLCRHLRLWWFCRVSDRRPDCVCAIDQASSDMPNPRIYARRWLVRYPRIEMRRVRRSPRGLRFDMDSSAAPDDMGQDRNEVDQLLIALHQHLDDLMTLAKDAVTLNGAGTRRSTKGRKANSKSRA